MEQHILTVAASVAGAVVMAFATMRAVIADLRKQNASQQKQIDDVNRKADIAKEKADKCEEERLENRRNLYSMLESCPVTNQPCPLRAFFKIAGERK
jgi:ADP-ribosylglycohydrolase